MAEVKIPATEKVKAETVELKPIQVPKPVSLEVVLSPERKSLSVGHVESVHIPKPLIANTVCLLTKDKETLSEALSRCTRRFQ